MRIVRARKKVQVPGYEEQEASPEFLDERGGEGRPEEVPDGGDAVDKELDRGGGGADLVQDLIDVVGEETVARPLREDCAGVGISEWSLSFSQTRSDREEGECGWE